MKRNSPSQSTRTSKALTSKELRKTIDSEKALWNRDQDTVGTKYLGMDDLNRLRMDKLNKGDNK